MSHTIELSMEDAEAKGIPVIRNKDALFAACAALGLAEPQWHVNEYVGDSNHGTGYAVQLKGWTYPVYCNTKEGKVIFDNYPIYNETHADVRNGARRVGEGGRWGDFNRLLALEEAYCDQAATLMAEHIVQEASMNGEMARVIQDTEDNLILEILN